MSRDKKTIGLIGLGNFGLLLAAILNEYYNLKVYNYSKDLNITSKAEKIGVNLVDWTEIYDCDVVIVSTPISVTKTLIKRVAKNLKKGALLLDVCSVKEYPCKWLEKYAPKRVEIIGTHPMFGPTTTKFDPDKKYWEIKGKQIVLCPLRVGKEKQKKIEAFLKSLGLEIIITSPRDHDYQTAKSLNFVHFLGRSLTEAGITEQKIYTPGYSDLLKILPHTNNDKWQLFCDMNNFNPYAQKVRKKFTKASFAIEEKMAKSNALGEMDYNRKMIDKIDTALFDLLETRMKYSQNVGKIKKQEGGSIINSKREDKLIKKQSSRAKLSSDFIRKIYKLILKESYKKQK